MGRIRSWGWWLGPWLALGCGPIVASPDDAGSMTSTTMEEGSTADAAGTTEPLVDTMASEGVDSTATTTNGPDDAALCVQWCVNAEARGCDPSVYGETCYGRCLDAIQWATEEGCLDEHYAVLTCEGQVGPPSLGYCESLDCEDEYKRDDLCRGWCAHLDGYPGSGGSQTDCHWSSLCYGHDFEAECPVNDAQAMCSCRVDGEEIAQCEAGISLAPFDCGGEALHVFTSCCREAFEGVLFP